LKKNENRIDSNNESNESVVIIHKVSKGMYIHGDL